MAKMACKLHLDITISVENVENDLRKIVPQLRPEWKNRDIKFKILPRELHGGLLNLMVIAFSSPDNKDALMFRIRRDEQLSINDFLNRDNELENIQMLHETKQFHFVPHILASYENGFCYEYIEGKVMTSETIRLEPNWRIIAKQLALVHSIALDEKLKSQNCRFSEFMSQIAYPDKLADPKENEIFEKYLPKKDYVIKECEEVKDHLTKLNCENVFCHNDAKGENMVWNNETGEIKFVDWECAGTNSQAYEIAYQFRCFTGNENANFAVYPNKELQWQWYRVYLETYYGVVRPDHIVTDDDVKKLHVQVNCNYLLILIQSMYWLGMIEEFRYTEFDILNVCIGNYNEYRRIKDETLALKIPH